MEKLKDYRRKVGVNLHGEIRETADLKLCGWEQLKVSRREKTTSRGGLED
jgi:hypothetical protein